MRKVYRYMRVSTDEQAKHGHSLESQDQVLKDYAAGHKLIIVESFVESESAFTTGKRPEFARMCRQLRRSRDIRAVLCYKIDRMARNMTDFAILTEGLGVSIISMTEGEVSDSENMLVGGMHAIFARHYSKQLSERVTLGLETKARQGDWPTRAPVGYMNRDRKIEINPATAHLVVKLFERYAAGDHSLQDLTVWARGIGLRSYHGTPLAKSAIRTVLANPFYYGDVRWNDSLYKGNHTKLISRELWDAVQDKLHDKTRPRGQLRDFPFRGILTCGYCGCAITASLIKGRYVYYHCTRKKGKCQQPFTRQEVLSDRLRDAVTAVSIPRAAVNRHLADYRSHLTDIERTRKAQLIQCKADLRRIEELRTKAYTDKLQMVIEESRWREVDRSFHEQESVVRGEIERLSREGAKDLQGAAHTFKLLELAPQWYNQRNDADRARLLKTLGSNFILKADNIEPVYHEPFASVSKAMQSGDWWTAIDVVQTMYAREFRELIAV